MGERCDHGTGTDFDCAECLGEENEVLKEQNTSLIALRERMILAHKCESQEPCEFCAVLVEYITKENQ